MNTIIPEIQKRFSVRAYQKRAVEREKIDACLEAASLAPSACNKQPWHFIVVDDPELKEKVANAAFNTPPIPNKFAYQAPVIIVVLARKDFITHKVFGGMQDLQYFLLDIGAAVENLILQAVRLGLGSCWLGWFSEKGVKKVLDIPKGLRVASLITPGYPDEKAERTRERKPLSEISSTNKYE